MIPRTRHSLFYWALLVFCLNSFLFATDQSQTALVASITLRNGKPQNYFLSSCDDTNLWVAGESGAGRIGLGVGTIEQFTLAIPPVYASAIQEFEDGKYDKAEALMAPYLPRLLPYLNLSGSNVGPLLFYYGETLRNAGRLGETEKFYKALLEKAKDPDFIQRANAAYVYTLTGLNKYAEAENIIKANKPLSRNDPAFPLDKLARGRLYLYQKKYRAALDQCAQLLVYFRIKEPWYPEAQYVMAESYAGLASELKKENPLDAESFDLASQSIYAALYSFSPKSPWTKLVEKKLREKPKYAAKKEESKTADKKAEKNITSETSESKEPQKEEMPFSDVFPETEKSTDEMQ